MIFVDIILIDGDPIWKEFLFISAIILLNKMAKTLLVLMVLLGICLADSCGGNCPSGRCPTCYCGNSKKSVDIGSWCSKYNWSQSCCKCIVSHESGGNANAINYNSNASSDVGLWQINTVNWGSCSGGKAPCDPNTNLNCAIKVYQWGGNSWKLWSTHSGCGCWSISHEHHYSYTFFQSWW